MTELKTLKNIYPLDIYKGIMKEDRVIVKELKQEAIKWCKNIQSNDFGEEFIPYKKGNALFFSDWIKHFFNITEEDLK